MKNFLTLILIAIVFWDMQAQTKPMLRIAPGEANNPLRDILITKDGRSFIFCGEDKTIQIRDTKSGEITEVIYLPVDNTSLGLIYAAAISKDEKYLAVGGINRDSSGNGVIRLFDFNTKKPVKLFAENFRTVHALDFSDDGKYLIAGTSDKKILVWETKSGKCISIKSGFKDFVYHLKVANQKIYAISFDGSLTKWNFYDSVSEKKIQQEEGAIYSLDYCKTNKLLATQLYGKLCLVDTNLIVLDSIDEVTPDLGAFSFSIDGKFLVASAWRGNRKYGYGLIAEIENKKFKSYAVLDSTFGTSNAVTFIDNRSVVFPHSPNDFSICTILDDGKVSLKKKKQFRKGVLIPFSLKEENGKLSFARVDEMTDFVTDTILLNLNDLTLNFRKQKNKAFYKIPLERSDAVNVKDYGTNEYRFRTSNQSFIVDGAMGWGVNKALRLPDSLWAVSTTGYLNICDKNGQTQLRTQCQFSTMYELLLSADKQKLFTYTTDRKLYIWSVKDLTQKTERKTVITPVANQQSFHPFQIDTARKLPQLQPFLNQKSVAAWDSCIAILQRTDSIRWRYTILELQSKKNFFTAPVVEPLAIFYLSDNKEWVLSTPEGYYVASPNGANLAYWHLNRGELESPLALPVEALAEKFYRPDLIFEMLKTNKHIEELLREKGEKSFTIEDALYGVADVSLQADTSSARTEKLITLKVTVKEQKGVKVSEVRLSLNGRSLPEHLLISKVRDSVSRAIICTYKIPLVYGGNNFSAIAVNERKIQSPSANFRYNLPQGKDSSNLYLLALGVDEYAADELKLTFAVNDANSIALEIGEQKVSGFQNIFTKQLFNRNATKENIRQLLTEWGRKIKPNDVFVCFYSGHAITTAGSVDQLPEFYMGTTALTSIQPENPQLASQAISSKELKEMFALVPATRQLLLLDACQSAGAALSFKRDRSLTSLSKNSGLTIFAATRSKQNAYEYSKLGHGAFTH